MVSSIVYNGDGTTRIFPVDFKILGENFVRVYVDDVEVTDKRKYDIINNSIVFNEEETPQIGQDNITILIATSESELGDLGAPITDIVIVAQNIADINSVGQQVVPNLAEILQADDNAIIATQKALEASNSATSASGSATTATTQAGIATAKASEASTSANNASTSEANALSYRNTASTHATTATTQAGIAVASVSSITEAQADTLAILRSMSATPSRIWVSGYHTKGDGAFGSNIFEWDSTSVEDDNGGTIIKLDSIATGRYKLRYSGSVNVKWFGAKGDGVTDDTIAITNAFKTGSKVFGNKNDSYYVSFLQLSGDETEPYYINSKSINFNGNGCTFIMKNFIGETPPSSLGLEYGFGVSVFSLNGFNGGYIENVNFVGTFFDDIANDSKPYIEGVQGTNNAYHTRTKVIAMYKCDNIKLNKIYSEKFYACLLMRECHNCIIDSVVHKYANESFNFQDCDNLKVSNCSSLEARFTLNSQPGGTGNISGEVKLRSDGSTLYTIVDTPTGNNGVKVNAGYGFIVAGCQDTRISNCTSTFAGSECFRVQKGPTGREHNNVVFESCTSIGTARYAFSHRGGVNKVYFLNCIAEDYPEHYTGNPPSTKTEALAGVTSGLESDLLDYWAFRLPRDTNSFVYGGSLVIENCIFKTKDDLKTWSSSNETVNYMVGYATLGLSSFMSFNASNSVVKSCLLEGQCMSQNGAIQFLGGDVVFDSNTITTSIGTTASNTVGYIFNFRAAANKIELSNNTVTGGMYTFTKDSSINVAELYSRSNKYKSGMSIFRADVESNTYFRMACYSDILTSRYLFSSITDTNAIGGVLFDSCTLQINQALHDNISAYTISVVLFKTPFSFYAFTDQTLTYTSRNMPLPRTPIKIKSVTRLDASYTAINSIPDEGEILHSIMDVNTEAGVYYDIATIYENDGITPQQFKMKTDGGGYGIQNVYSSTSSSSINGCYKIEYDVLDASYVPLYFIRLR